MISKRLFDGDMPEGPFSTNLLWDRAIAEGRASASSIRACGSTSARPGAVKKTEAALRHG